MHLNGLNKTRQFIGIIISLRWILSLILKNPFMKTSSQEYFFHGKIYIAHCSLDNPKLGNMKLRFTGINMEWFGLFFFFFFFATMCVLIGMKNLTAIYQVLQLWRITLILQECGSPVWFAQLQSSFCASSNVLLWDSQQVWYQKAIDLAINGLHWEEEEWRGVIYFCIVFPHKSPCYYHHLLVSSA